MITGGDTIRMNPDKVLIKDAHLFDMDAKYRVVNAYDGKRLPKNNWGDWQDPAVGKILSIKKLKNGMIADKRGRGLVVHESRVIKVEGVEEFCLELESL